MGLNACGVLRIGDGFPRAFGPFVRLKPACSVYGTM